MLVILGTVFMFQLEAASVRIGIIYWFDYSKLLLFSVHLNLQVNYLAIDLQHEVVLTTLLPGYTCKPVEFRLSNLARNNFTFS